MFEFTNINLLPAGAVNWCNSFLCQMRIIVKKYNIEFCTDSSVVFGVGAVSVSEEGSGVYPAQEGGRYVRLSACVRGNGCGSRTGSRVQHSIRGLHIVQDSTQVGGTLNYEVNIHCFFLRCLFSQRKIWRIWGSLYFLIEKMNLNVCFSVFDLCRNPWSELSKTNLVFVKMKNNNITINEW